MWATHTLLQTYIYNTLQNTELVFLITDAEESGLRGARAYVKEHYDKLTSTPHYNYNMDSLFSKNHLRVNEEMFDGEQGEFVAIELSLMWTFGLLDAVAAANVVTSGVEKIQEESLKECISDTLTRLLQFASVKTADISPEHAILDFALNQSYLLSSRRMISVAFGARHWDGQ